MDRRSIVVVVLCMVALFALPYVANKIFPPIPKPQPVSPAPVDQATNVATGAPLAAKVSAPAVTNLPPTPVERPPEQTVTLSNQFVAVEFTSWGGGIRTVRLLKHRSNGRAHVVLNADAPHA
ncbi:MAG: hypothetical protein N3B01_07050, partial [Verrucomicrobiae bacterium]|nr:hypothetical protein [Verrucomicrobiae bacterium]